VVEQSRRVDERVFLMRHAAHKKGTLTRKGAASIQGVAARFAEWLDCRPLKLFVQFTGALEVQQTASALVRDTRAELHRLDDKSDPFDWPFDSPPVPGIAALPERVQKALKESARPDRIDLGAYEPNGQAFKELAVWLTATANGDAAPLLVGNDPLVGWLAGQLTGKAIPVDRGELICLHRRKSWLNRKGRPNRPRWRVERTLAPDDGSQEAPVLDKIKSKMDTAKVLGAVITGLLIFLLRDAPEGISSIYTWLALGALGTAAGLYFATLFLYDSLLMPARFWGSRFPRDRTVGRGW
jgi:hypothetical protein